MNHFLACLLAWSMVAVSWGQSPQTALVRTGQSQGSGVLCGGSPDGSHRAVLTVAHVVGPVGNRVGVQFPGKPGTLWHGTVYGSDPRSDAALVVIRGTRLEDVPDALIWTGEINTGYRLRTEGYAAGTYRAMTGQPLSHARDNKLAWSAPTLPGMSGGPTYLTDARGTHFLSVTTGSDFSSFSVGPYRTWFADWLPTCSGGSFPTISLGQQGRVNLSPRRLEGPLTPRRPQRPEIATASETPSIQADPQPGDNADVLRLLQDALKQPEPRRPQIDASIASEPVTATPGTYSVDIPITVRVTVTLPGDQR